MKAIFTDVETEYISDNCLQFNCLQLSTAIIWITDDLKNKIKLYKNIIDKQEEIFKISLNINKHIDWFYDSTDSICNYIKFLETKNIFGLTQDQTNLYSKNEYFTADKYIKEYLSLINGSGVDVAENILNIIKKNDKLYIYAQSTLDRITYSKFKTNWIPINNFR